MVVLLSENAPVDVLVTFKLTPAITRIVLAASRPPTTRSTPEGPPLVSLPHFITVPKLPPPELTLVLMFVIHVPLEWRLLTQICWDV
jgi:hypothetical protein